MKTNILTYEARATYVASRFLQKISLSKSTILHDGKCKIYHEPEIADDLPEVIKIEANSRSAMKELFVILKLKELPLFDEEGNPLLRGYPENSFHRKILSDFGFKHDRVDFRWLLRHPEDTVLIQNNE